MMTFPQVIIGDELVGGFTRAAAAQSGRLDDLLAASSGAASLGRAGRRRRARRAAGSARTRRCPGRRRRSCRSSCPQRRQGSPARAVHQEAVLEAAAHAVEVAEVVDRGPARVDARPAAPRASRRAGASLRRRELAAPAAAGARRRARAPRRRRCCRPRRRCAGRAGTALIGARRPRASARRCAAREALVEGLEAEPGGEEARRARRRRERAAPVPKRRGSTTSSLCGAVARRARSGRACRAAPRRGRRAASPVMRRCMSRWSSPLERPDEVLAAPLEAARRGGRSSVVRELRGRAAARTSAGRGSRPRRACGPTTSRRELAADRLDLGQLGHVCAGRVPTGARER